VFQIERIKRANGLWTNDSLFLRKHLLIPVPCDDSTQQCLSAPLISHEQLPNLASGFSKVPISPRRYGEKLKRSQTTDVSTTAELIAEAEDDVNRVDIGEYFRKYDSVLAKVKHDVSKFESNTSRIVFHCPQ